MRGVVVDPVQKLAIVQGMDVPFLFCTAIVHHDN